MVFESGEETRVGSSAQRAEGHAVGTGGDGGGGAKGWFVEERARRRWWWGRAEIGNHSEDKHERADGSDARAFHMSTNDDKIIPRAHDAPAAAVRKPWDGINPGSGVASRRRAAGALTRMPVLNVYCVYLRDKQASTSLATTTTTTPRNDTTTAPCPMMPWRAILT